MSTTTTPPPPSTNPGSGRGPHPEDEALARLRDLAPEDTETWTIDDRHALYDATFRYPGQRSFFNGVTEASNEHLRDYLAARARLAGARREVHQLAHRLRGLRRQAEGIGASELNVRATQARERLQVERLEGLAAANREAHATRKARIVDLQRRLHAPVTGLSLPVALLFLVGFFGFAAADFALVFAVSRNVLSLGYVESVIFSVSIACMPLIVKPFVDRYVEKPYHDGERPRFTRRFFAVVMALVVLYLAVFGFVRYREEIVGSEERAFMTRVEVLLRDPSYSGPTTWQLTHARYWHRAPLYMMAGGLAALGGAICLVMAFGPLPEYMRRLRYWLAVMRKRAGIRSLPAPERLSAKLADARVQLGLRDAQLALFERLATVETQLLAAQRDEYEVARAMITAYTEDEYQRGSHHKLDEPLKVNTEWMETEDPDDDKGTAETRREGPRRAPRRSTTPRNGYLHERLRQHIQQMANQRGS